MSDARGTGSAAVNGRLWGGRARDWAEIQEGMCRPCYVAAFDHVGLGAKTDYLDAGCGAGAAALLAAGRGARVSGLDASESLLEIARSRLPGADLRLGDLEALPFANESFDVVTGFNSFQYAADPIGALREARRVARTGAAVVILTWGPPEGMEAASVISAIKPLLPPPPPGAPGPFALSDESALRRFAESAGLSPVEVSDVDSPWEYPDLETALRGLKSAGVGVRAIEQASEEAVDAAHAAALKPLRRSDGSYRVGARFRYLIARA